MTLPYLGNLTGEKGGHPWRRGQKNRVQHEQQKDLFWLSEGLHLSKPHRRLLDNSVALRVVLPLSMCAEIPMFRFKLRLLMLEGPWESFGLKCVSPRCRGGRGRYSLIKKPPP